MLDRTDVIPRREWNRVENSSAGILRTPCMASGLMAMDKEYFYKLGAFDDQMDPWDGGEVCSTAIVSSNRIHIIIHIRSTARNLDSRLELRRLDPDAIVFACWSAGKVLTKRIRKNCAAQPTAVH